MSSTSILKTFQAKRLFWRKKRSKNKSQSQQKFPVKSRNVCKSSNRSLKEEKRSTRTSNVSYRRNSSKRSKSLSDFRKKLPRKRRNKLRGKSSNLTMKILQPSKSTRNWKSFWRKSLISSFMTTLMDSSVFVSILTSSLRLIISSMLGKRYMKSLEIQCFRTRVNCLVKYQKRIFMTK